MPEAVHLLQGPLLDWYHSRIACGLRGAYSASWDRALVTCPACLGRTAPRPTTAADGMSEKALQEALRQACTLRGWLAYHVFDSRHSPAGWPDLVALRDTRLVVAELKSAAGVVTPEQEQWLQAWRRIPGASVHVWRPDDLDQALEVLR